MKNLIVKFLRNSISNEELETLSTWIKEEENEAVFKEYIETHCLTNHQISPSDVSEIEKKLLLKIAEHNNSLRKNIFQKYSKYAAAAIIVFGLVYFFKQDPLNTPRETTPIIVNTPIKPGTDKATLTLGDGSMVVLEKGNTYQGQYASSNGEEIVYEAGKQKPTEIVYNYLTIPRGGEYYMVLADGTRVWLNSETQLKYPENFIEGETREVELVYGEAYFDVSPSTDHKGSKFKVFNKSQEVEVLGTAFNIKAYQDEVNIYTTLVEGKVVVDNGISKQNLIPNQQSNLDIEKNSINVTVVDVEAEISWKNGVFSFIDKPLKDIMKVVSRWYDVDVVFENKELESIQFMGTIGKDQSIEEVLSIMKSTSINNYKINNKTVILR